MARSSESISELLIKCTFDSKHAIRVETSMMDFDYVEKCKDLSTLKEILRVLVSGREGRYPDLESCVETKILKLMPAKERKKIHAISSNASLSDVAKAREGIDDWLESIDDGGDKAAAQNADAQVFPEDGFFPPVRNKSSSGTTKVIELQRSEYKSKERQPSPDSKKLERISKEHLSNRDYFREWDKFDVEKAIDDIDSVSGDEDDGDGNDDNIGSKLISEHVPEIEVRGQWQKKVNSQKLLSLKNTEELKQKMGVSSLTKVEREFMASREKDKGNECFKNDEYESAITFYSNSIALDDENAVVYANRAMACIRVSNLCQAVADCDHALVIDPNFTKALARRGMIHHKCGRYFEAMEDLARCLCKEPDNEEYRKLWDNSKQKHDETIGEENHQKTKIRIMIEEDDSDSSSSEESDVDDNDIEEIYTPGSLSCKN